MVQITMLRSFLELQRSNIIIIDIDSYFNFIHVLRKKGLTKLMLIYKNIMFP